MARALATLAPPEREAIVLFELEGFTLEEVAALQTVVPLGGEVAPRARARDGCAAITNDTNGSARSARAGEQS